MWAQEYPLFTYELILGSPPKNWSGLQGSLVEQVANSYVQRDENRTRNFYICGIGQLVLQLRDLLRKAGYERRAVKYEKW